MRAVMGVFGVSLWLVAASVAGEVSAQEAETPRRPVPACVKQCRDLEKSGELNQSISLYRCITQVCQTAARKQYAENDFEGALLTLDHIKSGLAGSSAFQFDRGVVLYALGRFDEALVAFDQVLETYPDSVRASAQRGHTLMRLGRLPEARAQFEKILAGKGADAEYKKLRTKSYVRGNLALIKLVEGDLRAGKRGLERALKIDGRNELAQTFLRRVVPELESGSVGSEAIPHLLAAFEEIQLARPNPALKQMQTVLSKWPNFRLGYFVVADVQRRFGAYDQCEDTLKMAEIRFEDDVDFHAERIRCALLRHGVHSNEAMPSIAELRELARKDPHDPLVQEIMTLLDQ